MTNESVPPIPMSELAPETPQALNIQAELLKQSSSDPVSLIESYREDVTMTIKQRVGMRFYHVAAEVVMEKCKPGAYIVTTMREQIYCLVAESIRRNKDRQESGVKLAKIVAEEVYDEVRNTFNNRDVNRKLQSIKDEHKEKLLDILSRVSSEMQSKFKCKNLEAGNQG